MFSDTRWECFLFSFIVSRDYNVFVLRTFVSLVFAELIKWVCFSHEEWQCNEWHSELILLSLYAVIQFIWVVPSSCSALNSHMTSYISQMFDLSSFCLWRHDSLVAIVIVFTICWTPFHAQRLLWLYVSLYGQWTDHLRQVNQVLFLSAGKKKLKKKLKNTKWRRREKDNLN